MITPNPIIVPMTVSADAECVGFSVSSNAEEVGLEVNYDIRPGKSDNVLDGNSLEYGLTDATLPFVGVAKIGSAVIFETVPQIGTAQIGYTVIGG